jgi:FkbM family methyltransferase
MDALFMRLPLFKGKQRLAKLLLKKDLANGKKDICVKGRFGCSYLLPNLIENVSLEIFINGIYEKATSDFFVKRLAQGGVFLDLGANIGAISIPLYQQRNDIKIVCVEAAPWLFPYLQKNLDQNGFKEAILINKALFNTDNEEIDFYSPDEKFGKGSLSPTYTDKAVKVKTIRLDTLLRDLNLSKVDTIKIDVEGYEYHVFQGAEKLLAGQDAPDILFEFEDWAEELAKVAPGSAQAYLREKGYRLFRLDSKAHLHALEGEVLTKGSTMLLATKRVG